MAHGDDLAERLYWRVLVLRCQLGDRAALEELVGECQPRLQGFLRKLIPGRDGIDDLAQEVWADVFRDLPNLNDPAAFLPWLYRITHHRAFRKMRRRGPAMESIEDVGASDEAEQAREFTADDAAAVHAGLDQLAAEHREVLLLRFMEDMSYEDIARVIDRPLGTVRSRIHNAKRELRRVLQRISHDTK